MCLNAVQAEVGAGPENTRANTRGFIHVPCRPCVRPFRLPTPFIVSCRGWLCPRSAAADLASPSEMASKACCFRSVFHISTFSSSCYCGGGIGGGGGAGQRVAGPCGEGVGGHDGAREARVRVGAAPLLRGGLALRRDRKAVARVQEAVCGDVESARRDGRGEEVVRAVRGHVQGFGRGGGVVAEGHEFVADLNEK